ncbi:hypothetical protein Cyrtocomes_01209 [Candidatus Cyrtobacter comes]|uniref:Uncharacterized protein n=1 Tax=Candidatus Cyrtobacter comes TaxID=675776 RepID=A0ABU5L9L2_9RICK|nr:hypothetical protein [Candidatus Cyrtobacter comes]
MQSLNFINYFVNGAIKDRKISPDKADALAITFALPYVPRKKAEKQEHIETEFMDFDVEKYGELAWMR